MNYTYHQDDEVILLSTRRDTKKFGHIVEGPKVAVLVHDFPHLQGNDTEDIHGKSWSITLNGTCQVLEEGSDACNKLRYIS